MKMKFYFLSLALLVFLGATAQVNGIYKAYAFRTISIAGTYNTGDDNGSRTTKPIFVKYTVFIESASGTLSLRSAIIDGKKYTAAIQEVASPHKAGFLKGTEKEVIINTKNGNKLWQVDLMAIDGTKQARQSAKQVILYGSYNGKNIVYKISRIVNLESPLYY
jgi:hypothetical protein